MMTREKIRASNKLLAGGNPPRDCHDDPPRVDADLIQKLPASQRLTDLNPLPSRG